MNKQPFRLGWGFRGGDRGQGTSTWRCSTMNKQQPFRSKLLSGHKRAESEGTSDTVTERAWIFSTAPYEFVISLWVLY